MESFYNLVCFFLFSRTNNIRGYSEWTNRMLYLRRIYSLHTDVRSKWLLSARPGLFLILQFHDCNFLHHVGED